MGNAGEAVAWDVVEVVATQIKETRVWREALRNFGMATILTRGVVCLSLKTRKSWTDMTESTSINHINMFALSLLSCLVEQIPVGPNLDGRNAYGYSMSMSSKLLNKMYVFSSGCSDFFQRLGKL